MKNVNIKVDEKLCKHCRICSELCPKQVFVQEAGSAPKVAALEKCVSCKLCQMWCPDFAIEVEVA